MNIPAAEAFYIPNHNFEAGEVVYSDCIESDVDEDDDPFKQGVNRVS